MWFDQITSTILNGLFPPRRPPNPGGIALGRLMLPPYAPIVWPDQHRTEHAVAIGKTGTGKTHFLELLALEVAKRGEGFAIFDFHGDVSLTLTRRLLDLADGRRRLVVLDPSHPTLSPAINVLEAQASDADRFRRVSELSSILRQRWGVDSFGARTEELLRNSLYALASSHHTLADLPRLLTDAAFRREVTHLLDHPDIALYWRDRYEPLSDPMKAAFREPLLNKVTAFLTEPAARHLLAQPTSSIAMDRIIEERRWLVIRLPKGRLREHAHTLGNLLFAQLQFAALAREAVPRTARSTFTLICDEAQNLAENVNDLTTILAEGRKFGISIITANQFWDQLPKELRGALLSAASQVCFRVSASDAHVLAQELAPDRRQRLAVELTELNRGEAFARFGTAPATKFKVFPLAHARPLDGPELDDLVKRISRPRAEIEAEIRHRTQNPVVVPVPPPSASSDPESLHDW